MMTDQGLLDAKLTFSHQPSLRMWILRSGMTTITVSEVKMMVMLVVKVMAAAAVILTAMVLVAEVVTAMVSAVVITMAAGLYGVS